MRVTGAIDALSDEIPVGTSVTAAEASSFHAA